MANGSSDAARDHFPGFSDIVEIGRGRLSTVYGARDTDTGHPVALKLLTTPDPGAADVVERESAALGSAGTHPNIVTLYGTRRAADGRPVLVLELCRGSITQWLTRDGLPVPDVVTLGVKIAAGLDAAHRTGIVHGDLATHRILVTAQGEPALNGFGLGRLRPAGAADVHRPPELLDGRGPTPAGDVYSLASALYELITGRAAFDGGAPRELADRIRYEQVPPLRGPGVPAGLSELLLAALAKDPAHRPPGAGGFAGRLAGIQRDLVAGMSPAPGVVVGTDDGWSTPSLVGAHQVDEPPAAGPVVATSDWSTPSLGGRHAAPQVTDEPVAEPVAGPVAGATSIAPESDGPAIDPFGGDMEPPSEMTRRRPLATMSTAFGEPPVSADQAGPLPDLLPPVASIESDPDEAQSEVETGDPSVVRLRTQDAGNDQDAASGAEHTRRRPITAELPPPAAVMPPSEVPPAEPIAAVPDGPAPTEHTLPGPIEPRPEPMVVPAARVLEVAQGEQVRGHTQPRPTDRPAADAAPDAAAAAAPAAAAPDVPDIPVAAPSREPAPDPEALAAALWAAPAPPAGPRPPAVPAAPPAAPPQPSAVPHQDGPSAPDSTGLPPAQLPPAQLPPDHPRAGPDRAPAQGWDADALAAAIWSPGQGPAQAGEESGRYPLAPESEVPTATGPVPTWAFGTAPRAAPGQAPAPAIGDLTLDPASLRRKVTVRSGGSSLTIDETKLVLRHWLRKTELDWPSVRGFEPRFEGDGGGGQAGRLVAMTDSGALELPATRRSMADLRYLHALLDAYRKRALSGG